MSDILADEEIRERVDLKFGIYANAQQEPDLEERFLRADLAAGKVKNDLERLFAFYGQS